MSSAAPRGAGRGTARLAVGEPVREDEVADRDGVDRRDQHGAGRDVLRELRHRVERGGGDVDRRLERGVDHLRDQHERDREQQRDQLELARRRATSAAISTTTAMRKWIRMFRCVRSTWMIPSNAKLKLSTSDGGRGGRVHCAMHSLSRLHLRPVVVPEQVQQPVHERRAPLVADDLRAEDDVAERRGTPVGSASRRRSGTRARPSPRRSRGARASARGSRPGTTNAMPELARRRRPPPRAPRRARAIAASLVDLAPASVVDLDRDHQRLRCVPVSSAWRLYASTIRCTSLWRTTSSCVNSTKAIAVDAVEDLAAPGSARTPARVGGRSA